MTSGPTSRSSNKAGTTPKYPPSQLKGSGEKTPNLPYNVQEMVCWTEELQERPPGSSGLLTHVEVKLVKAKSAT
jgi:hypothetical protein